MTGIRRKLYDDKLTEGQQGGGWAGAAGRRGGDCSAAQLRRVGNKKGVGANKPKQCLTVVVLTVVQTVMPVERLRRVSGTAAAKSGKVVVEEGNGLCTRNGPLPRCPSGLGCYPVRPVRVAALGISIVVLRHYRFCNGCPIGRTAHATAHRISFALCWGFTYYIIRPYQACAKSGRLGRH